MGGRNFLGGKQHNVVCSVGGVQIVESPLGLFETSLLAGLFMDTKFVGVGSRTTIVCDMIFGNHVHERQDVGNTSRMEPYRAIVSGHVGHPVGSRGAA